MCLISKVATCGKLLNLTVSYADFAVQYVTDVAIA